MMLRPDTLALTVLLALLTALGPLSTDMYLPSLPALTRALGASPAGGQLTLSAFLFGFAAGQIVYGPLADRFGRKPVLLAGLVIFCAASAACALAPSIEVLSTARFVQAFGACGPIVLARSIVRDLYEGPRAGRELARMASIMAVVPAAAPLLGGMLEVAFGWRSNFALSFAIGLGATFVVAKALPETLRAARPEALSPRSILASLSAVARTPATRVYIGLMTLGYAGIFAWISSSSFVLQGLYGLGEIPFALCFGISVFGYMAGTFIGPFLIDRHRFTVDRVIGVGCLLKALGGVMMLTAVLAGLAPVAGLVAAMALYLAGVGCSFPNSIAGALQRHPDRAGAASSLAGFVQMGFSALVGIGLGQMLGGTALPLAGAVAAMGIAAFVLERSTRAIRAA
ncbi:multidrug effflux MFS transporter [Ancylobacter terrae]|uniref:multidrug effflux MFS transporter n=1 Tax=Ancylobacter sp. sgz301288 TaxID=3342077 RepID=UPI00385CB880